MIDQSRVLDIYRDCANLELLENSSTAIRVQKVTSDDEVCFDPECLNTHRQEIISILDQLPGTFRPGSGGDSFGAMDSDEYGAPWTSSLADVECLLLLGVAIERIEYVDPREIWDKYPRSPYVWIG
jgi:hypothetical protein